MSDPQTRVITDLITLDQPIKRGDTEIKALQLRKPQSGELRGLSLVDLGQLDVNALHKVLPRITIPSITEAEARGLDPADLLELGAEVGNFLLKRGSKPDFPAT